MIAKTFGWFGWICALAISAESLRAQELLFTNNFVATGLANSRAVAHDGNNTWVVVGDGTNVVQVQFVPGVGYSVANRSLPSGTNLSLNAIVYVGDNTYIAAGRPFNIDAPRVVISKDGGTNWIPAVAPVFGNLPVQGLAYDDSTKRVVAVGAFAKISYTTATWPPSASALDWAEAAVPNPQFLESFTSVKSLGGGRFVATGIAEGMRYSPDNGVNWFAGNLIASYSNPNMNLADVTSDGTLVAVGNLGRVMRSTNNGTNWNTGIPSPVSVNLYSIVSLGANLPSDGNLLAMGEGGVILRTTNGITWNVYSSPTAQNIRGSFFAGSGPSQLTGTGVLVGDNATVVIAGTHPLPSQTNGLSLQVSCPDDLTNLTLSVTPTGDVNHPLSALTVDWFADPANGGVLANGLGTINFTPSLGVLLAKGVILDGAGSTQQVTFHAQTRDLRTGFTSTNRTAVTITVLPEPTGTNTAVTICSRGTVGQALQPLIANGLASTFSWVTTNNPNVTGESTIAVGTGTITDSLTNVTGVAQTVIYTVTPTSTFGCQGTNFTVAVTVNSEPTGTNTAVTICSRGTVGQVLQPLIANGLASTFSWVTTNNPNVTGESTIAVGTGTITDSLTNVTGVAQTVIYTVTPTSTFGCPGTNFTVAVTVNPEPAGTNAVVTMCSRGTVGQALQPLIANGLASTFSWVTTNNPNVTGESTSAVGTGTITDSLTNVTGAAQTVIYTVTPTSTTGCPGTNFTVTVTVNPEPVVTSVANQLQILCNGEQTAPVTFSGNAVSYFMWVKNNTNSLLGPVSGVGTISPFTVVNNGVLPQTNDITVIPVYTNSLTGGDPCMGASTNVVIVIGATLRVTNVVNQTQTIDLGQMTASIDLGGNFTGMAWTNNNPGLGGLAASGSAENLAGSFQLMTFTPTNAGTMTITFTPFDTNAITSCPVVSTNVTITVVDPTAPVFVVESLSTSNIVLMWTATTNTTLLSATNLTPVITWFSNASFGAGTNRFTNTILTPPPYRFFRLTNAP